MANLLKFRLGVSDDPSAFQPSLNDCLEAMLQQANLLITDVLSGMVAAASPTDMPADVPAGEAGPAPIGSIEDLHERLEEL